MKQKMFPSKTDFIIPASASYAEPDGRKHTLDTARSYDADCMEELIGFLESQISYDRGKEFVTETRDWTLRVSHPYGILSCEKDGLSVRVSFKVKKAPSKTDISRLADHNNIRLRT